MYAIPMHIWDSKRNAYIPDLGYIQNTEYKSVFSVQKQKRYITDYIDRIWIKNVTTETKVTLI